MDNYSHTPGPDKGTAKKIISNKLQKIKSDWKYVTDKEIENIVNIMIEEIYPKKKEDYCLGSNLGWIVSVEKTLYNNGINKITELNEKNKIKCCMD